MRRFPLLAASLLAFPALAQNRPPPQDKDSVVVTASRPDIDLSGPKPMVRGGLWRFDHSGTLAFGGGDGRLGTPANEVAAPNRPFHFSTCLPGDDLEATLKLAAGERSNLPRQDLCGTLRLTIKGGRITGQRACTRISHQIGVSHSKLEATVSGRYDVRSLSFLIGVEEQTDGVFEGNVPRPRSWRWRVTAARLGDCPTQRVAGQRPLDEAVEMLFDTDIPIWADPDGI